MCVLVAYRGQLEARALQGGKDVRVRVEVLAVLLAEGFPVTGPRKLDPRVARAGAGIDDTADHEVVSRGLTRDHGVGDGEAHHRVGVEIEDEPAGGPKADGHRVHRQSQLVRGEVVEAVERADRGVEDAVDRQVGESCPGQRHLGAEALASNGQHRLRCVNADDLVAANDQLTREEAGAAAEIEH